MPSKDVAVTGLNTGFTIIEKMIALLIALGSLVILYYEVSLIYDFVTSGIIQTGKMSYWDVIKGHHLPVLVSILGVFGGWMMLFNDKKGWQLSLIASAMLGVIFLISSRTNAADANSTFAGFYKSYGYTAIGFLLVFVVLLLAPFRRKYQPAAKDWAWIAGIIALLIVDKLVF